MVRAFGLSSSVDHFKKEAKRWLKQLKAGDPDARARLELVSPGAGSHVTLREVQHALAREYGHTSWKELTEAVAQLAAHRGSGSAPLLAKEGYERLAADLVLAFDTQDADAMQQLNAHYQRSFTSEDLWAEIWRRVYAFRQRAFKGGKQSLLLDEARLVIAQDAGFSSWDDLTTPSSSKSARVPPYEIDDKDSSIGPRRTLTDAEWDDLLAVMKERRLTRLDAHGLITDAVVHRLAALDHVTRLNLGGSRQMTDAGLLELARMPQLEHFDLSEYPGGKLTDRGLAVLAHLPNLRVFEMTWQRGISDAGAAHLKACDRLERVNLMGSPTGNGAIEALQGKTALRHFSTGRLVTDEGLPFLQNFPWLRTWHEGAHLLVDGPFTNAGLASLTGLEGVAELDLFWHVTGITSDGFAHLTRLPNLISLGADGRLSDNTAMRHYAAMPKLARLRCQGTIADDDGFEALSRSQTIAHIWGRECPNLGSRGFVALSKMSALHSLGVSCKNVDDAALSTLQRFPSLRELTPIDVQDAGFAHVGRCARLERLTCMYCRETTDVATSHILNLPITYYYAGLTQITDRSLELLGRIPTLEQVEIYECNGVTDAGLPYLAALPKLREVHLDSLPGVTFAGTRVFPAGVRVKYST